MSKFIGRFRHEDGKSRDLAQKRIVARFAGAEYTAEREGDELVIYCIGDDDGIPGAEVTGSDAMSRVGDTELTEPQRLRALNEANRAHYKGAA